MKYYLLLFAAFLISSCNLLPGEKGNGHVIKSNRTVAGFHKLSIDGVFHVFLTQGAQENVVIETDENLISLITTEVQNGELTLDLQKGKKISRSTKLNIYVTCKNLDELSVDGVNQVSGDNLTFQHLTLDCNGVGTTSLKMNCNVLDAHLSGVGSTTLTGTADSASIENSGVGALHAFDFVTQKMIIANSGVGSAEVNAQQTIAMNNSGVGSIEHKGNAAIKSSQNDGVGKIKKVE